MKKFWKDYVDLWKHNNEFYKKHWFGVLMFYVVSFTGIFAYYFTKGYIEEVKSYSNKKEEES